MGWRAFRTPDPVIGIGIVPGLGLKFPVDGDHQSENAIVMRMLDPQDTGSVFEHPFTNILPTPALTNVVMQVVRHRFETVVVDGRGLHLPVDNLARVSTSGQPEAEIRAPQRLILAPTPRARALSDSAIDFREDLARNIPEGTTIYDVFGLDSESDDDLDDLIPRSRKIGRFTTESAFIASSYGDYRLFFKHSDVFLRDELATA